MSCAPSSACAASLRETFEAHHADLYEVDFWRRLQERNRAGEVVDFYPYSVR